MVGARTWRDGGVNSLSAPFQSTGKLDYGRGQPVRRTNDAIRGGLSDRLGRRRVLTRSFIAYAVLVIPIMLLMAQVNT